MKPIFTRAEARYDDGAFVGGVLAILAALAIALLVPDCSTPALSRAGEFLSRSGNTLFLTAGYLTLLISAFRLCEWNRMLRVVLIALTVTLIVHALKLSVGHWAPRPSGSAGGFPSGHAAAAFALAFQLSRRFPRGRWIWQMIAIGITWSRVALHAHWFYQVAAGAPIGLVVAIAFDGGIAYTARTGLRRVSRQAAQALAAHNSLSR